MRGSDVTACPIRSHLQAAELDAGLTKSHELFDIYPLLLYPCALKRNRGGMLRVGATGDGDQLNANLGIYGVPRQLREQ